ncbi:TVP38/TMEM64 family protein [Ahrensia marina]|uniref:TVP38/TMEM64 family membrane protein n=1 Tax=Ahrensia marina TaxID=1514904 RepID=A0A0M9GLK5_9HYPH|nr:TVP38/TMEM64 family protein [Ahrensia marina]KPB00603.1 mercuric reductase [Ahrensia marina]
MTDTAMSMTQKTDDIQSVESPQAKTAVWKRYLPVAIILGGLGIGYAYGLNDYFSLSFLAEQREALSAYVEANFAISLLSFGALYAVATAFSFPAASILTIFGGFLFGWLVGGIVVAVSATLGATALFLAAKTAFGDFLKEKVGGRVKNLAEGFENDAFSYLLVLRIAPVFPFFIMNIAPALFNVSLRTYVAATFLGILPGVFAYAYLGQGVESVLIAAQESGQEASVADLVTTEITLAFAALAIVAVIPTIVKKLRRRNSQNEID